LLRTLRPPIGGAEDLSQVNAVAVSPDGRFIAAGGWDARFAVTGKHAITVFDAATGGVTARIGGYGHSITNLVFSPDGRWLIVSLNHGDGVRMFDAATWEEVASDTRYGGFADGSYGASFGPDGRLYTASLDGKIRRYGPGPGFVKEVEAASRGGKIPYSIAMDPKGARLAVGYDDMAKIDLYDAATLRFHSAVETGESGSINSIEWRRDAMSFVAGGSFVTLLTFDREGKKTAQHVPSAGSGIFSVRHCGAGFVAAAGDGSFGLLDQNGRPQSWWHGVSGDMRSKIADAFTVAPDGYSLRFGLAEGSALPVLFDLKKGILSESSNPVPGLTPALVTGMEIYDWLNQFVPRYDSKPIELKPHEMVRSLAIRPDRKGFILGTDYYVRAFDTLGRPTWSRAANEAYGVNLAADGQLVIVAFGDGTIRWLRWSDGAELLAMFANKDTKEWVAWTPTGYYSASPGGENLIGWQVNRGWGQSAEFYPASKFHDQFARADIVRRMLDTLDEPEAIRLANAARGGKAENTSIIDSLPPQLSILAPSDGTVVEGSDIRIDYLVRSSAGLPVDSVEALLDGRPMATPRGYERLNGSAKECLSATGGLGRSEGAIQGCRGSLTVSLPAGASTVGLFARSGAKTSEVATLKLTRSVPSSAEMLKPKLYALVVGVSAYRDPSLALTFPAKDARDFAAALQNQKGNLYSEVNVRLLPDDKATSNAIKDGFDWLTKQVTSRDVGVVFLAGHGMLDERERFYFLAADSEIERLRATALPREEIQDALDALAGKALLFLDACHAGAMGAAARRSALDINSVVQDFSRSERGVITFAASTGRQVSLEEKAWNNGAFTKAVVEGLGTLGTKGLADLRGDGRITASLLDAYVTDRVKTLTHGAQSPVMIRPATVPDFTLAVSQ
jgi:WD40 repeat protein